MAGQGGEPKRQNTLLALAHPLRRRILRRLGDREEPASPVQLADELEVPLGAIAYHVRVLCLLGPLSAAGGQHAQDAIEHVYVSAVKDGRTIETLLEETKKEEEEEE